MFIFVYPYNGYSFYHRPHPGPQLSRPCSEPAATLAKVEDWYFFSRARLKLAIQTKKMVVEQNWRYLKALNIGISTWVNTTEKLGDNIHQISLETR
jgi:hypothetical protein